MSTLWRWLTHKCIVESVSSCLFFLHPLRSPYSHLFNITLDTNVKVSNHSLCFYLQYLCFSLGLYVRLQAGPKEWPDHSVHRRKLWVLPPSHNKIHNNILILWIFYLWPINATMMNANDVIVNGNLVSHLTPSFFIRHSARKEHLSSPLGLLQNIR